MTVFPGAALKNHEVPAGAPVAVPVLPAYVPIVSPIVQEPVPPDTVIGGNMRQDQVAQDRVDAPIESTTTTTTVRRAVRLPLG